MIPDNEIERWITLDNGTHVPVRKGLSNEEATEEFVINKINEEIPNVKKDYEFEDLGSLVDLSDEVDEPVSDAISRISELYPSENWSDKIFDASSELESVRQEVINEKIDKLTTEEIERSKISDLLGKSDRRMTSYGDQNMSKIIDKIDDTINTRLEKIRDRLNDKGLDASINDSNISESKYLTVIKEDGEGLSFRLSDHISTGSGGYNDVEVEFTDNYGQERTIERTLDDFEEQVNDTIYDEWDLDAR